MTKKQAHGAVDTSIALLGQPKVANPLAYCRFVDERERVRLFLCEDDLGDVGGDGAPSCLDVEFELAGPRQKLFFEPTKTKCAIVTCGGLCPGINDVIRALVLEGFHNYRIAACLGIRFGLQGFIPSYGHNVIELTPERVADIHQFGGTILGSSRGPQPAEEVVDALERMNVNALFMIGGDGTMQAAARITAEAARRGLKLGVIGIPKTIDNDIAFVSRSFGFDTAVEKAAEAISCAHTEAVGAFNGVGVVRLMGRESGFIAAHATLAMKEVNFVLVPEYPFQFTGTNGLLPALRERLALRSHAVIVLAEGAGQHLCGTHGGTDASGNPKLCDISTLLLDEIKQYFGERKVPVTIKYIDPSYIIRSVPANSGDRVFCGFLGQHAMHAAMAGKTAMVVSRLQDRYVHLPLSLVAGKRKRLNLESDFWRSVLETTGQSRVTPFGKATGC